MYKYFLMYSIIVNCKCSIGGFPVGVNWVLGGGFGIHICVVGVLGFAISKLLVRGYA